MMPRENIWALARPFGMPNKSSQQWWHPLQWHELPLPEQTNWQEPSSAAGWPPLHVGPTWASQYFIFIKKRGQYRYQCAVSLCGQLGMQCNAMHALAVLVLARTCAPLLAPNYDRYLLLSLGYFLDTLFH